MMWHNKGNADLFIASTLCSFLLLFIWQWMTFWDPPKWSVIPPDPYERPVWAARTVGFHYAEI